MGNRGLVSVITIILALMVISSCDSALAAPGSVIDLSDADASFIGESSDDQAGFLTAGAGDVNGDGYEDILIGAQQNDNGGLNAGQAYLIFGKASGWSIDTDLSKADASFLGEAPNDGAGRSVAGAGDVNGDGYDDILVGAPKNREGGRDAGQVYLIFGKATGWSMDTDLSNANASFWGEDKNDNAGIEVAGAGDVNNDGYDDFLIGAHFNEEAGYLHGQAYLILGKASGWAMDTNLSNADASFWGNGTRSLAGASAAGVGDVNNDGYDDFLIGSHGNSEGGSWAGQAYLILGKSSGWAMDTDLSDANASFVGENQNDQAGGDVAGAGDVNGDGYDDMLISAFGNDEGGSSAGQIYLVLGRSSGWSTNTSLSNANASFLGERANDKAGLSMGIIGDVNSDGYDDILIGASYNDDGGADSGQTYLIYGKASGWSMDTNLSTSDAFFVGEKAGDESGCSVAGPGDVNGDGSDDILIAARYNDDGGSKAGKVYLVFFDDSAIPKIEMDRTPMNATTGDKFTFNVSASDDTGVRNVSIEYWYGNSSTHFNISANRTSGNQTNGTWARSITIPSNSTDSLHYIIFVRDGSRYQISTHEKMVDVHDNDPPSIGDDLTDTIATTGDELTFIVNATDNINLSDVRVVYWYGTEGIPKNVSMAVENGDTWYLNIDARPDYLGQLHYFFYAIDNSTNNATSSIRTITIADNDPPNFIQDQTPPYATAGDDHTFFVEVIDNINLSSVWVEYWFNDQPHQNITLVPALGDLWNTTIIIASDTEGILYYLFGAVDNSSNVNLTQVEQIPVNDKDAPMLLEDLSDTIATTGDPFVFRINATDNIAVSSAHVLIWWGPGTPINNTMTAEGDGTWTNQIWIAETHLKPMNYMFKVVDASGNWNESDVNTIVPTDNDPPVLYGDDSPREATTGEDLIFKVRISDYIGVGSVNLSYSYNFGPSTDIPMAKATGSSYTATITVADVIDTLGYVIIARDISGNEMTTEFRAIGITDNDAPTLVDDLSPTTATTGDMHTFRAEVVDNIDVASVIVEYRFVNEVSSYRRVEMTEESPGIWSLAISVPFDSLDMIRYSLFFYDSSGNEGRSPEIDVIVRDGIRPEIVVTLPSESPIMGMPLEVLFDTTDNIGVSSTHVAFWYGDGEVQNESTGFPIQLEIPRRPGGDLFLVVSAVDMTGNWNGTEAFRIPLVNIAPEVADLPTWDVIESTDAEYELLNHITDPNDAAFTITCQDEDVTVDGMVLRIRYDTVVPDRTITLTISDGDDKVEATLSIHVVNVNDPPLILNTSSMPGSKFKESEKVTFTINVTDEDGDELTITWKTVDKVLGTGQTIVYQKLKPGRHTVTVTVDDGTVVVEDTVEVVIKKEEESPGFGLVVALAALVLTGLVVRRRR